MEKVKVNKDNLLETIKANLDKHIIEHKEALELRREKVVVRISKENEKLANDPSYQMLQGIDFPMPQSHEAEYRKAIKKLEMTVDTEITIDDSEFERYVLDNWSWKRQFDALAATYKGNL